MASLWQMCGVPARMSRKDEDWISFGYIELANCSLCDNKWILLDILSFLNAGEQEHKEAHHLRRALNKKGIQTRREGQKGGQRIR